MLDRTEISGNSIDSTEHSDTVINGLQKETLTSNRSSNKANILRHVVWPQLPHVHRPLSSQSWRTKITMDEQLGSGDAGSWLSLVDWFVLGFGLLVALAYFWQNKFESRRSQICVSFKPIIPAQTSNGTLDTHSFVAKMKAAGKNMVVFYGSQTGTAEDLAFRLAKDAVRYGMKAIALDPEEYDPEDLYMLAEIPNSLAVFCMATYGEGDPTDNAREFFEYLHRSEADLSGVNYAFRFSVWEIKPMNISMQWENTLTNSWQKWVPHVCVSLELVTTMEIWKKILLFGEKSFGCRFADILT
ncbi:NADPH--cytochrome P450 reductase [Trichinella papuae]|uniref:NADPH--cytochrome P450 reductase n=1 Tax=Trichinella papuae TaxID=268474 RepID=A0A0V1N075_9BILA|nr:NADPH--cytochrome P450 reductase [Trichinella papuae]